MSKLLVNVICYWLSEVAQQQTSVLRLDIYFNPPLLLWVRGNQRYILKCVSGDRVIVDSKNQSVSGLYVITRIVEFIIVGPLPSSVE